MATEHDGMTPTEQLRAFIERVKGEHRKIGDGDNSHYCLCQKGQWDAYWPCSALRAVLALEEMTKKSADDFAKSIKDLCAAGASMSLIYWRARAFVDEALARAAQKIGGGA